MAACMLSALIAMLSEAAAACAKIELKIINVNILIIRYSYKEKRERLQCLEALQPTAILF
jgi:hypothetical protein